MNIKAFQIDLGRQIERPDFVEKWIPPHAEWGYNVIILYLEDAFRFPSHPEFAKRKAWTCRQMERVVKTATRNGMTVIPVVPALGHTGYILKNPKFRHLSEKRWEKGADGLPVMAGQICPSLEETHAFFTDLFEDVAEFCTAGYLHVSLDESFDIGICPLCKRKVAVSGQGTLFVEHLKRLRNKIGKLKLRTAIWGDMFYYFPEKINDIPKDVAVFDWYYYPFRRFPRIELHNFREIDSANALVKAGLETWACPNNGPFFYETYPPVADRLRNISSWWRYGMKSGCHAIAVTSWSPFYAPSEMNFLVNASAADLWLDKGVEPDLRRMIRNGLRRLYGTGAGSWSRLIERLDVDHISGHRRYQIVKSRLISMAVIERTDLLAGKAAAYARAAGTVRKAPDVLAETFRIRSYHLSKERLSASGSGHICNARKALALGDVSGMLKETAIIGELCKSASTQAQTALNATRRLWQSARYVSEPNPLEKLILEDINEYKALDVFLKRAKKEPAVIMESNPLMGRRQLLITVRNRKPALQGLRIEISSDGMNFKDLHRIWLLEFTADAGRPNTDFVSTHTVALPDDMPCGNVCFRFKSMGIGEFDIRNPILIEMAAERRASRLIGYSGKVKKASGILSGAWVSLGAPAPKCGLPSNSDFQMDNHLDLAFEQENIKHTNS